LAFESFDMSAEIVLATRPGPDLPGLVTVVVLIPEWIWNAVLTHRRFCRGASSGRAQSVDRHQEMGYYTPPVFHERGKFMQAGDPLPPDVQALVAHRWHRIHQIVAEEIDSINAMVREHGLRGVAKEEINRLLPTTKMMRCVITGTEPAWEYFFSLRIASEADNAMQRIATVVRDLIRDAEWKLSQYHVPFAPAPVDSQKSYKQVAPLAAARLARISNGAPGPGQRSDEALSGDLARDGHWPPFEHIAQWVPAPAMAAMNCRTEDRLNGRGWEPYRIWVDTRSQ
jgi:hypothetical protein